jgi:hypothetical protein
MKPFPPSFVLREGTVFRRPIDQENGGDKMMKSFLRFALRTDAALTVAISVPGAPAIGQEKTEEDVQTV